MREESKLKTQIKCRLKVGDEVVVISGSHKGESGKIIKVDRKHDRVVVSGVNVVKRHTKPTSMNQTGGIVDKQSHVHVSKVMLLDPKRKSSKGRLSSAAGTRVGYQFDGENKQRVARRSKSILGS